LAVEKLEHQLHKLKTKLLKRSHTNGRKVNGNGVVPATDRDEDEADILPRIVKTKSFQIKPMTPEEATLQMGLMGHDFFFFTNADTQRAAVVYRRDDGDVVLMDVRMPRMSGIEATRAIADAVPTAKILMLTVSDEEEDLYEAVKAGATGYLLKEISIEEVANAIRAVVTGQSLISPSMASKLLSEFNNLAKQAQQKVMVPKLTERELQVLKLVAQGMSNREVAEDLFISENTVKNHVRNILEKLHLHSRMEAVVYAVRE